MIHLTSIKDIEKAIADNRLCLFYIKAPDCGVCNVMLDKVERLADSITAVYSFYTDITEEPLIAGQFLVFLLYGYNRRASDSRSVPRLFRANSPAADGW